LSRSGVLIASRPYSRLFAAGQGVSHHHRLPLWLSLALPSGRINAELNEYDFHYQLQPPGIPL
jgi:hypothetical protein